MLVQELEDAADPAVPPPAAPKSPTPAAAPSPDQKVDPSTAKATPSAATPAPAPTPTRVPIVSPLSGVRHPGERRARSAFTLWRVVFGVASLSAQLLLRRHDRLLIRRNATHRLLLRGRLVLHALIGIQMGRLLRPLVGGPDQQPTTFLRTQAWRNACAETRGKLLLVLGGG